MHNCQCHYQCQYSIDLSIICSVHFQKSPLLKTLSETVSPACCQLPADQKALIPRMLQMLELTADPMQEETKVDTSAHVQSKSVIRHSVHRPCCQQSTK